MPEYALFQDKDQGLGLNTRLPEDKVPPGKAIVSDNVHYRNYINEKRPGYSPVLLGDQDTVLKGGPPGSSTYVIGHRPHLIADVERSTFTEGIYRPFNYAHRDGLIVIPEGDHAELQLDVQAADPNWSLDFTLWSDDFQPSIYDRTAVGSYWRPTIVAAKGDGANTNWAIRIIMDGADITIAPKFRVVLTLYEAAVHTFTGAPAHTQAQDFFFDDLGGNKSWFVIGKRMWFGFFFDTAAGGTITPYYKLEGGAIVTSAAIAIAGGLRTNGTRKAAGDQDLPIMIGKRAILLKHNAGATHGLAEQGFNGVLGEFRKWGATHPTWTSWAYTETEIPDSELDDSGGTVSGDNDLELYYSFADHYRDTNISRIDPRYSSGTAANGKAWLTGADATWVAGSSKLGAHGLQIVPEYGIADQFRDIIGINDDRGWLHTTGGGIRVPGGVNYLERLTGLLPAGQYRVPDEMSFRVTFKLPTDGSNLEVMSLVSIAKVTGSVGVTIVAEFMAIEVVHSGGNWVLHSFAEGGLAAGASSAALTLDTEYTAVVTFSWQGASKNTLDIHQYIDGTLDGSATGGGGRPAALSNDTNSNDSEHSTAPNTGNNTNKDDQRRKVYPMSIGYSHRRDAAPLYGSFFGGPVEIGNDNGEREWAFYGDDTPAFPNSGIHHRGWKAFRGIIGSVTIWHKVLSQPEIDRFVDRGPFPEEIAAYGDKVKSHWDMEEGMGNILWDKGQFGNHLRMNPYPEAKSVSGPIHRLQKGVIDGFWEIRTRTPREGVGGRDVYALSSGSVLRLDEDGSGDKFFRPIANRIQAESMPTPSSFQFSDFLYVCTGVGPPLRLSRGKVSYAGLSPVFGEGLQHDNLGWLEHDRDGTFQIREGSIDLGTADVFNVDKTFRYAMTFYDPEAGVESAPSRIMYWTMDDEYQEMILDRFPRSHHLNATVIRLYRSRTNSGELLFLDEIPISQNTYTDTKKDTQLGFPLNTFANFPPPQGVRFAIRLGGRVVYSGVDSLGATVFPSLVGFPEAVPPGYAITVAEGRSARVTGLLSMHDRGIVFLQDTAFSISDNGGDVGTGSLVVAPVSVEKIKDSVGCVEHNTIVTVDDLGGIFAGERGIYVTDGFNFKYASHDIEPTWQSLNKSTYRQWIAVNWRKNDQYVLACRRATGAGRNDTVLVWDYARNAFSVFDGWEVRYMQVIEDETTGQNRLHFSDYLGQMWEWDSEDSPVHNDGASRSGFTTLTGTVVAGSTTTNVRLFTPSTLPTTADGLRGVALTIGTERRRIISNTGTNVVVETAFSAVVTGAAWKLGSIPSDWKSGKNDMGSETFRKKATFSQFNFEENTGSAVDLEVNFDNKPATVKTGVDAGAQYKRVNPLGRGTRLQWRIKDDAPDNPWAVTDIETAWHPKGRSSWLT